MGVLLQILEIVPTLMSVKQVYFHNMGGLKKH